MENEKLSLNNICLMFLGINEETNNKIIKGNNYFVKGNGDIRNSKYFLIDENNPKYQKDSYGYITLNMLKENNIDIIFKSDCIMFFTQGQNNPFFIISLDVLEKLEQLKYFDKYDD